MQPRGTFSGTRLCLFACHLTRLLRLAGDGLHLVQWPRWNLVIRQVVIIQNIGLGIFHGWVSEMPERTMEEQSQTQQNIRTNSELKIHPQDFFLPERYAFLAAVQLDMSSCSVGRWLPVKDSQIGFVGMN